MSAETLRRAAAVMRERAEAATPGPWSARTTGVRGGDHWYICDAGESLAHISANDGINEDQREPDAKHIASWHPAVALVVADLLDTAALGCEVMAPLDWDYPEGPMDCTGSLRPEFTKALAVANAYLGEDA